MEEYDDFATMSNEKFDELKRAYNKDSLLKQKVSVEQTIDETNSGQNKNTNSGTETPSKTIEEKPLTKKNSSLTWLNLYLMLLAYKLICPSSNIF